MNPESNLTKEDKADKIAKKKKDGEEQKEEMNS